MAERRPRCSLCNGGHARSECPDEGRYAQRRYRCSLCGGEHHDRRTCIHASDREHAQRPGSKMAYAVETIARTVSTLTPNERRRVLKAVAVLFEGEEAL